jgi:hypothetical protein
MRSAISPARAAPESRNFAAVDGLFFFKARHRFQDGDIMANSGLSLAGALRKTAGYVGQPWQARNPALGLRLGKDLATEVYYRGPARSRQSFSRAVEET